MRVMVHEHALKHGLSEDDVKYVFMNAGKCIMRESEDEPPRWLVIGWLPDGSDAELIAVETIGGWLIIHAKSPVQRKFAEEISRTERRTR